MAQDAVHIDMGAVESILTRESEWRDYCARQAAEGEAYAKSIAPVLTGRYRASIYGRVGTRTEGGKDFPTVEIGATVDHAIEVEFQAPARHHTLLRTFDHLKE